MTRLTDERIAEIEALWSNDRQTAMDAIPDLLAEVKTLKAGKAKADAERDVLIDVLPSKAGCPHYAVSNWRNDMDKNCGTVIYCTTKPRQCWLKYAQQQAEKKGA